MRVSTVVTLFVALLFTGCGDNGTTDPAEAALFEVAVGDQTFTIKAEDQAAIEALGARLQAGEEGVINGVLADGDGGFNQPWSWHMVPGTIEVPDVAAEVCDGTPRFVENNLDYWLEEVGRYCPWSAEVERRIQ